LKGIAMKKVNKVFVIVVVFMGLLWGCGQGKYDDLVKINDSFISITRDYIDGLNKAENGKDVARAMNKYADEFKKLAPKMKEINEKYPGLKNAKDMPEKVKELNSRLLAHLKSIGAKMPKLNSARQ